MKTLTIEPFTFLDFLQMHQFGILGAVLVAVAAAWVFADRGSF